MPGRLTSAGAFFTPYETDTSAAVFPLKRGCKRAPEFDIWFLPKARSQLSPLCGPELDTLDTVALQPQTAEILLPENQHIY